MIIPLRADNPSSAFPLVTLLLLLAMVIVFTYQISPVAQDNHFTEKLGATPCRVVSRPFGWFRYKGVDRRLILPNFATLFTSMFLHGNLLHIIFNMLFLWIFGPNVEGRIGRLRFLFFYLLTGTAATLLHAAVFPRSSIPLIGASGAIAGVMGAYLMLFPRVRIRCLFFIFIIRIPAIIFLGVWILRQFWNANMASSGVNEIAWFAHIGGFLTGFFIVRLFIDP